MREIMLFSLKEKGFIQGYDKIFTILTMVFVERMVRLYRHQNVWNSHPYSYRVKRL